MRLNFSHANIHRKYSETSFTNFSSTVVKHFMFNLYRVITRLSDLSHTPSACVLPKNTVPTLYTGIYLFMFVLLI